MQSNTRLLLLTIMVVAVIAALAALNLIMVQQPAQETINKTIPVTRETKPEPVETEVAAGPSASRPGERPDEGLSGVVVDHEGNPLTGATVAAYMADRGAKRTTSDSDGRFNFIGLPDVRYRVSANLEGYNEAVRDNVPFDADNVTLQLDPLSLVRGRVLEALAHDPIERFEIAYLPIVPADAKHWRTVIFSPNTPWERQADPDGAFTLEDVTSGERFAIAARAEGRDPVYTVVPALEPGEQREGVDLLLPEATRIDGRVTDLAEQPVSNARIFIDEPDRQPVAGTDSSGRFFIEGVGEGRLLLIAEHAEYEPAETWLSPQVGRVNRVTIAMPTGGGIEGMVFHGENPVAAAEVRITQTPRGASKSVTTEENGAFHVRGLSDGNYFVQVIAPEVVSRASVDRLRQRALVQSGQITEVYFQFPTELARLSGTVTINGRPPLTGTVRGEIDSESGATSLNQGLQEDGTFTMNNLMPGLATIDTVASNGQMELKRSTEVELRAGEETILNLDMETGASIEGSVTNMPADGVGQVMALRGHVEIDLTSPEAVLELERQAAAAADVNSDGVFSLRGLEPGRYTLLAAIFGAEDSAQGRFIESLQFGHQRVTISPEGLTDLTIRLQN